MPFALSRVQKQLCVFLCSHECPSARLCFSAETQGAIQRLTQSETTALQLLTFVAVIIIVPIRSRVLRWIGTGKATQLLQASAARSALAVAEQSRVLVPARCFIGTGQSGYVRREKTSMFRAACRVLLNMACLSTAFAVRKTIEGEPVIVGGREHHLQVVGIAEDADGGASLTMIITSSSSQYVRLHVAEPVLQDSIALREQVVCFVNRILTAG